MLQVGAGTPEHRELEAKGNTVNGAILAEADYLDQIRIPDYSRLMITILIVVVRIFIFGQPEFQKQDNPASFHEDIFVRYGTFLVVSAKSLYSLVLPDCLVYDWQFGSIPLVESVFDERLILVALIGIYLVSCMYREMFILYFLLRRNY